MGFRCFRGTDLPRFAHPFERELAELLDEHGIAWEYEPHSFTLERSPDGTPRQAITPDFHLPDVGVYIECTAMKQSLVNRKNQKVRKLRERYGEVVVILYRRDLLRLRQKYGANGRPAPSRPSRPRE